MRIYIVRHAWAGEAGDPRWPNDHLRPLTDEGKKRFKPYVKHLAKLGMAPAVIATSPLVRCRQTAELLSEYLPGKPSVVELPALAPNSHFDELLRWTVAQGGVDVVWVGHAPDVGELTAQLIGRGAANIRFAKGACAEVRIARPLAPARGELAWLVTAKILGY